MMPNRAGCRECDNQAISPFSPLASSPLAMTAFQTQQQSYLYMSTAIPVEVQAAGWPASIRPAPESYEFATFRARYATLALLAAEPGCREFGPSRKGRDGHRLPPAVADEGGK